MKMTLLRRIGRAASLMILLVSIGLGVLFPGDEFFVKQVMADSAMDSETTGQASEKS